MKTLAKIFLFSLILCVLIAALLNSRAFGSPTLIAYFFSSILAASSAVAIFLWLLVGKEKTLPKLPPHLIVFGILAAYIFLHGIARGSLNMVHFYWITMLFFVYAIYFWTSNGKPIFTKGDTRPFLNTRSSSLMTGVAVIAFIESAIVILQCLRVLPVPNKYFLCTGTWINPNVTAMFLSLSLYSVLQIKRTTAKEKLLSKLVLIAVVMAIMLLFCRTAYIVTGLLLYWKYNAFVKKQFMANLKFNHRGLVLLLIVFVLIQIAISVFSLKQASAANRLQIWETSLKLISKSPLSGYGFGQFEKEYNLFSAEQGNKVNDFVRMPYNDYLELGVEGGIAAVLLWSLFVITLAIEGYKRRKEFPGFLYLVASFTVIQLTNFGFQAIPAMLLFLFFVGTHPVQEQPRYSSFKLQLSWRRSYSFAGLSACVLLLVAQVRICGSFYKLWQASIYKQEKDFHAIRQELSGYSSFHAAYGDLLLGKNQIRPALDQYSRALATSSNPDLFAKKGLCYQMLGVKDSSEYCYGMVERMQPYKVMPKYALLRLYHESGDSAKAYSKAKEISEMPIRVPGKKINEIRNYALRIVSENQQSAPFSSRIN